LARYRYFSQWIQEREIGKIGPPLDDKETAVFTDEEALELGLQWFSGQWSTGQYRFVPLVTGELSLRCKLDMLFLRPEEPRYIIQSGDLNARMKTIFDALRIPTTEQEGGSSPPGPDETPFYCLLEDDTLISDVAIRTDQLLMLPKERASCRAGAGRPSRRGHSRVSCVDFETGFWDAQAPDFKASPVVSNLPYLIRERMLPQPTGRVAQGQPRPPHVETACAPPSEYLKTSTTTTNCLIKISYKSGSHN
jgi:hypothetical protein